MTSTVRIGARRVDRVRSCLGGRDNPTRPGRNPLAQMDRWPNVSRHRAAVTGVKSDVSRQDTTGPCPLRSQFPSHTARPRMIRECRQTALFSASARAPEMTETRTHAHPGGADRPGVRVADNARPRTRAGRPPEASSKCRSWRPRPGSEIVRISRLRVSAALSIVGAEADAGYGDALTICMRSTALRRSGRSALNRLICVFRSLRVASRLAWAPPVRRPVESAFWCACYEAREACTSPAIQGRRACSIRFGARWSSAHRVVRLERRGALGGGR
jgi:hypothetical protein